MNETWNQMAWLPQPVAVRQFERLEEHSSPSSASLANALLLLWQMVKSKVWSWASLSLSWLLTGLVISAVLQQGMTAMWTQTPGCPVTALYHPDDRKEKLVAQVAVSLALVSILAYVKGNTLGVVTIGNILEPVFSFDAGEGVHVKGHKSCTDGKYQNLVCRAGSVAQGVWWVQRKSLVSHYLCVPVHVFSGMAVDKQQCNMVLILLLTPLQPVILWFENTRDLGWTHAHEHRIIP